MQHPVDPGEGSELEGRIASLQIDLDLMGLPACILDRGLRYRYANPAYCAFYGQDPGALLGKTPMDVFSQEPTDRRREMLAGALAGRTEVYDRQTMQGPNAGRWMRAHYLPVHAGGRVVGALVVAVDIQNLKDTQLALQDRERQLSLITDAVGFPITWFDREGIIGFINRPGARWAGCEPADMIGRPIDPFVGEEAMAFLRPLIARTLAGEATTYERNSQLPGLSGRRVRGHLIPDRDETGEVRGLLSVLMDIEDDYRTRQALLQRTRQLELINDNIGLPMSYIDAGLHFRYTNQRGLDWKPGLDRESVVGLHLSEVFTAESMALVLPYLQRALAGEKVVYEREASEPGGAKRWIRVHLLPDADESDAVKGIYTIVIDVDEDRRLRERLREQGAQLRAREEQLRFFAENIPESIAYIDVERGCTFINNHFLATRGFEREAVLGKFPHEVFPAQFMAMLGPHIDAVLRGEESRYERVHRQPDGQERWIRMRLTPHRDDAGRVCGYYVVSTDIHEIRSAQAAVEDKERELRRVIDSVPTPLVYVDAGIRYRYVNNAFLDYIGLPVEQVVGHEVREVLGEDRWAAFAPILERLRSGETPSVERLVRYADGRSRWLTVRLTPRHDANGDFLGYYATSSDIHEQKMVEEELRRTNAMLSAHFDNTPLAVIEWDTDLRVVRWTGQAETVFGWGADETLSRLASGWRLVYEDDQEAFDAMLSRLFSGAERHATILTRNYRKDGSVIWMEWHNSALRDENGRVISLLSLAQDVSSRIQAEERLQFMATHDGLTGLPNRVLLNDRLEGSLARATRARRRAAVMFLDLDYFKDVNDTLGHRIGDELLRELARRLRAALRQTDLLARISGDEFVMVLEDLPDDQAHERVAGKVLDEARRAFYIDGHEIHVSASLGMAIFPEDGTNAEALLKNADAAMYHAKELGRNSFRAYSADLAARRQRRTEIEFALRRALREGEFALHYQPIVSLTTNAVPRAEALLRWNDPQRGLVLPSAFIALAEETGLGHDIGAWVMNEACRQARAWRDAGMGDVVLCVNLSAGQLRDSTMLTEFRRILARTGCEASWLQFEITETSMVRDLEGVSATLAKLRALGVAIAIDDFGTGFSSLSHLRHLPVDALKVDKSFVADIESGGGAIVSAVIGLAKGLGLDVVAEGIERQAQLDFLLKAGCACGQGYLLCPPLAAADFEKWIKARRKRKRTTR